MKRLWAVLALLIGCLGLWGTALAQTALVAVPAYRAHVTDLTGVLAEPDRAALERQLSDFEAQRGTQIGVLVVPSTAPEDIADYSQRVADAWKLGRAGVGDGLLVVVALQERRVRIAPFKALEGAIPDVLAKRIIDEQIVPAFRRGDYAGGLRDALTRLQAHITGEALPAPAAGTTTSARPSVDDFDLVEAAMLLLVAVPMVSGVLRQMLGQRLGTLAGAGAAGWLVFAITQRLWLGLLAGVVGFFVGLLSRALPVAPRGGRHWGGGLGGGGFGGGGFGGGGGGIGGGGGGASSGGGGDGGGGGASGGW